MTAYSRNPGFNPSEFLKHYWQKKPFLIRNFLSNFSDLLSAEELAGLALEDGVESRLVLSEAPGSYQLRHGPFEEQDFLELAQQNWTLLVQAVDQWVPGVADLKSAFDFLPSWRIDDVMISHAVSGGGVGPHFDQYDVFLLQGSGSRTWQLGGPCSPQSLQVADSGLSLLKNFKQEQEVTLHCGDVLYIPPGFAHWGTGKIPGLCYSIGFRAPGIAELIESFSDLVIDECDSFNRYRDPHPLAPGYSAEIPQSGLEAVWQDLQGALARKDLFCQAFGSLVTRPRYPELVTPLSEPLLKADLLEFRGPDFNLQRNNASRFAWVQQPKGQDVLVCVDGEVFLQPRANIEAVVALCDVTIGNINEIESFQDEEAWLNLLLNLVNLGSLLPMEAE